MFPGLTARSVRFLLDLTNHEYTNKINKYNNKNYQKTINVGVRSEAQSVAPGEGEGCWWMPQGEGDVQEV